MKQRHCRPIALPTRADNEHAGHEKAWVQMWSGQVEREALVARQPVGDARVAYRLDDAVCDSNPSRARELNRSEEDAGAH